MIRLLLRILSVLALLVLVLLALSITRIDRTSYRETEYYEEMHIRLDSLEGALAFDSAGILRIGWSKIAITPAPPAPLAGYGARDPKAMTGIHDSSFVRTVLFRSGSRQAALVTADLLIFHPEVTQRISEQLPAGWSMDQVFLTATHTHSGQGGWAPGFVGSLFSGEFDPPTVDRLAGAVTESLIRADQTLDSGSIAFTAASVDHLVYNRLVGETGIIDPWLNTLFLKKGNETGIFATYSAHATCLGHQFRQLSGDFPGALSRRLEADTAYDFAAYAAGAVGSMGPKSDKKGWEKAEDLAEGLKDQLDLLSNLSLPQQKTQRIRSFRLPLPLPEPAVKISGELALRPYLFRHLFGDYPSEVSVLQLGRTVIIGLPCDFSGELAVPLYEQARELGINLIITSFNGSYIGYVVKDTWYDLKKYESRSMSWYGPYMGGYLSEIIQRIITILPDNDHQTTNTPGR